MCMKGIERNKDSSEIFWLLTESHTIMLFSNMRFLGISCSSMGGMLPIIVSVTEGNNNEYTRKK